MALQWLTEVDAFYACPQDIETVQRYVMAVFYYSTDGDNWFLCGAPEDFDEESIEDANEECTYDGTRILPGSIGGTDAWLTPVSECFWGALACRADTGLMVTIDFREYIDQFFSLIHSQKE